MLIEGAARGDRESTNQARWLVRKFPESALDPIRTGARATKEPWIRSNLIAMAHDLRGEKAEAFFVEELKGPWCLARVNAATALNSCGRPEGVRAMIGEWKAVPHDADFSDFHDDRPRVIYFLATARSAEAIEALGADLARRCLHQRFEVIREIGGTPLTG